MPGMDVRPSRRGPMAGACHVGMRGSDRGECLGGLLYQSSWRCRHHMWDEPQQPVQLPSSVDLAEHHRGHRLVLLMAHRCWRSLSAARLDCPTTFRFDQQVDVGELIVWYRQRFDQIQASRRLE